LVEDSNLLAPMELGFTLLLFSDQANHSVEEAKLQHHLLEKYQSQDGKSTKKPGQYQLLN